MPRIAVDNHERELNRVNKLVPIAKINVRAKPIIVVAEAVKPRAMILNVDETASAVITDTETTEMVTSTKRSNMVEALAATAIDNTVTFADITDRTFVAAFM